MQRTPLATGKDEQQASSKRDRRPASLLLRGAAIAAKRLRPPPSRMVDVAQRVASNGSAVVLRGVGFQSPMSPVALEITLLFAAGLVADWPQEIDRLSDEVEAAVMGIGEVVGYDCSPEAHEVTLLIGGEHAEWRLLAATHNILG